MRLEELFCGLDCEILSGTEAKEVGPLIYHSEKTVPGSVFFAINGEREDGSRFIENAAEQGCRAVVAADFSPETLKLLRDRNITAVKAADVRKTLALASRKYYGRPDQNLLTIGVTGTKGKTTVTFMIREILEKSGIKTGIIGTVVSGWENNFCPSENTTPQSADVYRLLKEMADASCGAVVMEVSSQAVKHDRVHGINFDIGVFTNISPDHIGEGEHKDFEEYLCWKSRFFESVRTAVINADSPYCGRIKEACRDRVITFGTEAGGKQDTDWLAQEERLYKEREELGVSYRLRGQKVTVGMAGLFNVSNSLAAIAACAEAGISVHEAAEKLRHVKVRGRVEPVKVSDDFTVLVDYAHNGTSLESLLKSLKMYCPERIVTVFGCGGNRDRNRRIQMGRTAAELSDFTIVTSDNPRGEEPEAIIEDITRAMEDAGGKYITETDRRKAVLKALHDGRPGDIIVLAGKGHETYQIIGSEKRHFDDREVILSWKNDV